jgi:hypothetical protein
MQGLKAKVLFAMSALGIILLIGGLIFLLNQQDDFVQAQALNIADAVVAQVVAEQFAYTAKVVQKLEQDGTGASPDAPNQLGYIHVPAQFSRFVADRVSLSNHARYQYRILSEWNRRPENGIADDFERWAWDRLKAQEAAFKANKTEPDRQLGYAWQPVYRLEQTPNGRVLRLLATLPASSNSCTSCHNALERSPEVLQIRQRQGSSAAKQWQLHDLMGALALSIPLQELDQAATTARNLILTGFGAALLLLTIMAMMIVSRAGTQPIRTVTATVASHAEQLEQSAQKLMSLNRDLALAAEQEQQSLQQLDFLKDVYSQDRTVQNLIESAAMHLDKAKQLSEQGAGRIEQSAMVCGDIAKHTGELMKAHNRMSKII